MFLACADLGEGSEELQLPLFWRILQKIYKKNTYNERLNAVFRPPLSRIRVLALTF